MSQKKKNRQTKRRRNQRLDASYDALEDRKMLATVVSLVGGELSITGDSNDNIVTIWDKGVNQGYEITHKNAIADNPVTLATYSYGSNINSIRFVGAAGNDRITNFTDFPMTGFGNAGDDVFHAGPGGASVLGGSGDDTFFGGSGNDTFRGNDGRDSIFGGDGDDILFGGNQNDSIFGGAGNDSINGERGNDTVFAGAGNDYVMGFTGDDILRGGEGNDTILGAAGDDSLYGDEGNDRLRGANGNDKLYGGDANDTLKGDDGDDELNGGDGHDLLIGYNGVDELKGDGGNDLMYGGNEGDLMEGGTGRDVVRGGNGDDMLYGGDGNDRLIGESGNDRLFGEAGVDLLFGGDGEDGLVGGQGQNDKLYGQNGSDRFLTDTFDTINDESTIDAVINLVDSTSNWNDAEVELLDNVLNVVHHRTGNARFLKDSVPSGDLTFTKVASLAGDGFGSNALNIGDGGNTFTRTIRFREFDETRLFDKRDFATSVYVQLGRNWNSHLEMTNGNAAETFGSFMALSQWSQSATSDFPRLSNDGNWYYDAFSSFTFASDDSDPKDNPYEDFATSWEYYFDRYESGLSAGTMQDKYDWMDGWISQEATV